MRDIFRLAKENAPAIVFIDAIDAIATAHLKCKPEQIVSLTMIELLNELH